MYQERGYTTEHKVEIDVPGVWEEELHLEMAVLQV